MRRKASWDDVVAVWCSGAGDVQFRFQVRVSADEGSQSKLYTLRLRVWSSTYGVILLDHLKYTPLQVNFFEQGDSVATPSVSSRNKNTSENNYRMEDEAES
nr:uncharacterized protein LOC112286341 isoform X3 [Physcomitrium patens]|eukprot:XP_024383898.1 uncharacterized protein LOC112286341 isoform X3 [Physcomitrella patens]